MGERWLLGAVGDVFLNRPDPSEALREVLPVFRAIDLLFGNCEGVFTSTPHYAPTAGFRIVAKPENAIPIVEAGFDVLSAANNHTVDAGHDSLVEMLAMFRASGVAVVGAGKDLEEARQGATTTIKQSRVTFLAYSSVYQAGYEARPTAPGIAALRVHTHYYVPGDGYARVEPGCAPHIVTFPYPEDETILVGAIEAAKSHSDTVVVSFHWGESTKPASLTDYEKRLGHLAIDAGADVVLGHHHHILRGIELYRDKPIFYGLGHFAFDMPGAELFSAAQIRKWRQFGEYVIYPREGYPLLPFHPDTRMTMIGICEFDGRSISRAGMVPCLINPRNQPVPLPLDSAEGQRVTQYMQTITADAGLTTRFHRDGLLVGDVEALVAR